MFKLWLPEYCEEILAKVSGADFLPLYQSFPAYLGLPLTTMPPLGSFLNQVCRRYAPELLGREEHDPADIRARTRAWFEKHKEWAIAELAAVAGEAALSRLGGD
jgi:hypothetical protein